MSKPKPGSVGQRIDPLAHQPQDGGGVAHRQAGFHPQRKGEPVAAEEDRFEPPAALAPFGQPLARLRRHLLQYRERIGGAADRFGEEPIDAHGGARAARRERAVAPAQQRVERVDRLFAKARRERGGGAGRQIADGAQPRAAQRHRIGRIQP